MKKKVETNVKKILEKNFWRTVVDNNWNVTAKDEYCNKQEFPEGKEKEVAKAIMNYIYDDMVARHDKRHSYERRIINIILLMREMYKK